MNHLPAIKKVTRRVARKEGWWREVGSEKVRFQTAVENGESNSSDCKGGICSTVWEGEQSRTCGALARVF